MKPLIIKKNLLYPQLSYQIIGILFDVFNKLGYRYQEKYYQKAIHCSLEELAMPFQEQISARIIFKGNDIGKYILDFIIDKKIVLEIKRGDNFSIQDIGQLLSYLQATNLKLGILARFSSKGLKFKRIINLK